MKIKLVILAGLFTTSLFIIQPAKCEGAIIHGAYATVALVFHPSTCEASLKDSLCSSVAGFLNDEDAKTDAAVKGCKKNCGLVKKKQALIEAAQKKVKDSCAKGITPDIAQVSKGLDTPTKEKLNKLYSQNNKMFDNTAELPVGNFAATSVKPSLALTGKSGRVLDLKASEPDIANVAPVSEFSLRGTKPSGETPGQAATKQSSTLLASASSAKSPACAASSAKTALLPKVAEADEIPEPGDCPIEYWSCFKLTAWNCWCIEPELSCVCDGRDFGWISESKCRASCICPIAGQVRNSVNVCVAPCPDGKNAPDSKGNCPCGALTYNPKESCCSADGKLNPGQEPVGNGECGCLAGRIFTIAGKCEPKDSKEGRSLTLDEMKIAENIFGDTIDYKKVRLVTTGTGDPHTPIYSHTIYFPGYNPAKTNDRATLLHELAHIYQKDNYTSGMFRAWYAAIRDVITRARGMESWDYIYLE